MSDKLINTKYGTLGHSSNIIDENEEDLQSLIAKVMSDLIEYIKEDISIKM